MISRRSVLFGFLAAPLVVRDYSILMPVKKVIMPAYGWVPWNREDLSNIIYNIEPLDTPLISMIEWMDFDG